MGTSMVLALGLALFGAHAAPVGFWHPDDLAPVSDRFMQTSEALQGPFEARSADADRLADALRQYREALDLLGSRAPGGEIERLADLQREFQRQHAVLQAFADAVISDYDAAFTAAVERAVAARTAALGGAEIAECEATVRQGPAMPGMPGRRTPNPDCPGENLNAALAATVDADAALVASLNEILSRPWPEVSLEVQSQAPVGGAERWLSVRDLMVAGARDALRQIEMRDDDARERIEAAIERGASVDELRKLEPEAERIEAETAAARAALAAPVLAVAEARMAKKWSSEPATGWCANPAALGGCTGTDASRDLVGRLLDDKKVAKALAGR